MNLFYIVDKTCYRRREEISLVKKFLLRNGWGETSRTDDADLVFFSACSGLRFLTDEKLKEINVFKQSMKPEAELVVGGCIPGMDYDRLRSVFTGRVVTPTDLSALNLLPGIKIPIEAMPPVWGRNASFPPLPEPSPEAAIRMRYDNARLEMFRKMNHYRPTPRLKKRVLKLQRRNTLAFSIAAGCARRCAYCAKPFASGNIRSKPIDAIMRHISDGIGLGYRAFDLYADSIGNYGLDQNVSFGELLETLLSVEADFTVGLFDVHTDDFIRNFGLIKRLCQAGKLHYIYVAVQSGNERILKLMRRPCNIEDLTEKLVDIRRFHNVFMQSGIIAGFPGETDSEFEDTIRLLERVEFDNVYVHYYCDMPNTESSVMPDKVDKAGMLRRLDRVKIARFSHNLKATLHEWESNLALPTSEPQRP